MKRTLAIAAAIVVALVFTFTVAGGAGATINLVVTTTADTHDANPGDGICADGTGACSLRAAIEESNDDCDTAITVSVGTYALTQGSLVVHCTVTLLGAGARTTTITRTGGSAFRIFEIASGTASISGVTITGGLADGTDVEDNPGVGAGVWIDNSGHLALLESTVTGNQASVSGGGIDSDGGLAVTRSTISNNSVTGSFLGIGGGIDDFGSSLDVADSTITGNSAVANGGGVLSASDATFVGDTIAGNTAAAGGGFFRYGLSNSQTFVNTIVSGNTGSDCSSPAPSSIGHNLTSDASCGFSGAGDLSSTDPLLGALHNNGGPTDTMLPALGSPAIDAGSDPACTGTDQRGVSRPQGAHCDIGALEVAAAAPSIADATRSTVSASPTSVPADFSTLSTITVTLKDASGTPLSGKTVSLTEGSGSAALGGPATTDGSGVATFTTDDSTAETVTYTAHDTTDGVDITQTASVTFTPLGGGGGGSPPPSTHTLTLLVAGGGGVAALPTGISCPITCSAIYPTGTTVTLTATALAGNTFTGWAGDCSGAATTCTVSLTGDHLVEAFFAGAGPPPQRTLAVAVAGGGTVTSSPSGVHCNATCSTQFDSGTSVTLSATPDSGKVFSGWTGDCSGSSPACTVSMTDARAVGAEFVAAPAPSGGGTTTTSTTTTTTTTTTPAGPVAAFTFGLAQAQKAITFDASASTGMGLTYAWDFGESPAATGVAVTHTYVAPGLHSVTLTVVDATGQTSSVTKSVNVHNAQAPTDRTIEGVVTEAEPFAPGGQAADKPAKNLGVAAQIATGNGFTDVHAVTDSAGHYSLRANSAIGSTLWVYFDSQGTGTSTSSDWAVSAPVLANPSDEVVDGTIPDGNHVLLQGTIDPPTATHVASQPTYEVRVFKASDLSTPLTLSGPGGTGSTGDYRLALPKAATLRQGQQQAKLIVRLYENGVVADSTVVSLPTPGGHPGAAQVLPILQASALHAVYPVAAQTTNVEGTVTKLVPFAPGSPVSDAGFAGISVTLTSPSNNVLTTVTDASGHYAFDNLQGDFVMGFCHLKVDAGGGNSRVTGVDVGPSPSTTQRDVTLGTSAGLTLVDGQAIAPPGTATTGLLQPHIEIKVFKGDTQTAVPLLAPGGAGTYGQYRIGFTAPAGSYRVVLYEGSIAVDSDYVSAAATSQLRDVTLRDLKGIANPATTILSRALTGHLTHVHVPGGVSSLVETPDAGITVELSPDTSSAGSNTPAFTLTAISDANGKYVFDHIPAASSRYRVTFSKGGTVLGSVATHLAGDPSVTTVDARLGDFAHEVILEGTYTASAAANLRVHEGATSILPPSLNTKTVSPGTYAVSLHSLSVSGAVTPVKEGPATVVIGTGGAAITIKGQTHDLRGKVADPVIEIAVPDIVGP